MTHGLNRVSMTTWSSDSRVVDPVFDEVDKIVVYAEEMAGVKESGDGRSPIDVKEASDELTSTLTLRED